jgi:uncharacterized protein (TIGR02588 family)
MRSAHWEVIISIFSLFITLGLLGYLLYQAAAGDDSPPDISVIASEVIANENHWLVLFTAQNSGGRTAAGVTIKGEIRSNGEVLESTQATLDYVPAKSRREGGLFFNTDPEGLELVLQASGYTQP